MPKSYIAKLDSLSSHSRKRSTPDDQMTPQELAQYHIAQKDLADGVNIVTWEEIQKKYA